MCHWFSKKGVEIKSAMEMIYCTDKGNKSGNRDAMVSFSFPRRTMTAPRMVFSKGCVRAHGKVVPGTPP
jgi:hypothetical protein